MLLMRVFLSVLSVLSVLLCFYSSHVFAILPVYPAEIIGRDLNIFGAGWIGHVGITTAPYNSHDATKVHDVLNVNPVIQLKNISDVKKKSPYRDSRCGISDRGDNALLILRRAHFQNTLGCASYTLTADYSPSVGNYDEIGKAKATYCGFFRCDTFVNYLFYVGHYKLPTYNPPSKIINSTYPALVFNSFPYGNGDGPKAREGKISRDPVLGLIAKNPDKLRKLAELSQGEFIAIVDVSPEKITDNLRNVILELCLNKDLNEEKRYFLMDKLGFIGTPHMLPRIIQLYYELDKNKFSHLKNQIIPTSQNLYQRFQMLQSYPDEKEALSEFYISILDSDLKQTERSIALRGLIAMGSNERIIDNIDKISSNIDDNKNQLPQETIIKLKLELINKIPELQDKLMLEILQLLKSEKNSFLDSMLTSYVVDRMIHFGTNSLNEKTKMLISHYLTSLKLKYSIQTGSNVEKRIHLFSYGSWLEASALLNTSSFDQAADYIDKYIDPLGDADQKTFIVGFSNSPYITKAFLTKSSLIRFKNCHQNEYRQLFDH